MKKLYILLFLLLFSCTKKSTQENSDYARGIVLDTSIVIKTDSKIILKDLFGDSVFIKGRCISGNCEEGKGVFLLEDSSNYVGYFEKGIAAKTSKFIVAQVIEWEGEWQKGKLIKGTEKDWIANTSYEGEFANLYSKGKTEFVPNGIGIMKYADGTTEKGKWIMGFSTSKIELYEKFKKKSITNTYKELHKELNIDNIKMIGEVGNFGVDAKTNNEKKYGQILRALRYQNITNKVEKKYGLPNNILLAMIIQETGGVVPLPNALGDGGIGLCHMQGIVAEDFGLETVCNKKCKMACKYHGKKLAATIEKEKENIRELSRVDERFNPVLNIDAAGRILASSLAKHNIVGFSPIQTAIRRYAGRINYPKYWKNISIYQKQLNNPKEIEYLEKKFNELNKNLKINGKKGKFWDYIKAHQNQNYNYGLDKL